MGRKFKYEVATIITYVKNSISYAGVLEKLGIKPSGGNYKTLKEFLKHHNIDFSHFKHQGHNKDKIYGSKRPVEYYLKNNTTIGSCRLKNRLLKENILDYKCSSCQLKTWLCKPIPLELDHIDGNNTNNSIENLRLLCPNCHALTSNYRGKNIKCYKQNNTVP